MMKFELFPNTCVSVKVTLLMSPGTGRHGKKVQERLKEEDEGGDGPASPEWVSTSNSIIKDLF